MKKTIALLTGLMFVVSLAVAQGQAADKKPREVQVEMQGQKDSADSKQAQDKQVNEKANQTKDAQARQAENKMPNKTRENKPNESKGKPAFAGGKPENISQHLEKVQKMIEEKANKSPKGLSVAQESVAKKQRGISEAVHGLLATENLSGGIGKQVSQIARDINETVNETINAEAKIQKGGVGELLFGGNHKAADNLQSKVQENKQRINQLQNITQNCENCNEEVKSFMQNQIQKLQQEQDRLQNLAQKEKSKKGLFGWIWK